MITLSRLDGLETLWERLKQSSILPDELKAETEQKLLRNKLEVRVNFCDQRIKEDDLQYRLAKCCTTIALVEPLLKEASTYLQGENAKLLVSDTNGVIISCQSEDVIGYCCPAAELINCNDELKNLLQRGSTLEVHYDNGIHSQLVPIFEHGEIQFYWGISDHRPISLEASNFLYLATQLVQHRYKYILMVDEYTSSLMNAISECAVLLDENDRIINVNERFLDLLRISDHSFLRGVPFESLLASPVEQHDILANSDKLLMIRVWDKSVSCRITYRKPIRTPYGTQMILLVKPMNSLAGADELLVLDRLIPPYADSFARIIGNSPEIEKVKALARRAARHQATVLIEGESGTGKELLAEAIHLESRRAGHFIAINCGAIPNELIQSELFGYDEGAFTGAKKRGNPGKLEMADGGTLFLDEIGEMPMDMQISLLRFLQNKAITRVGSCLAKKVNVMIIAATNRNLLDEVEKGRFRKDLYFRLNLIYLQVPPLRERKQDIPVLVSFFIEKLTKQYGVLLPEVSAAAMSSLTDYDWPGNVRELENVIQRAIILFDGRELKFEGFESLPREDELENIEDNIARVEKEGIEKYLRLYQGNISRTARALGVTRQTLYRKMKALHIDR